MKIQVRCTDGDVTCFTLSDEKRGLSIIESIKPSEFFNHSQLRIRSGKATTIFSMSAIESIHFLTSRQAATRDQPPAKGLRTITEALYREKMESLKCLNDSLEAPPEPGQCIDTLLALHCFSGTMYFLEVQVIAGHRVEQMFDLHSRLERLTSVIPCSPEGYLAINPRSITKIELYPAPPAAMHAAGWLVD